ncbi:intein splicing region [Selenomonas sp. oral taxon 892 str. F0426]|uniref:DNA polymerase n=1 Tax=Selenomonas sp. oral taxon 892 TaxID=1321785 RepID=UPI0003AD2670|nr:DNA polymerase [Selenomonas sp. oral taxon 892]ERJ89672.1 intein splicing region [Selenomonas sp. oral taxon 892 str. F0426]
MKSISIDLETRSSVDIGKSGVYRYTVAEDFAILLFGYSVDGGAVQVIDLVRGERIPQEILDALTDDSVIKWAFNANFERVCLSRYLSDFGMLHTTERACFLSPHSWRCTMVWSAYMGLPLSLAAVGRVLGLEEQKMNEGKALIRYFSTPPFHEPTGAKWELFKSYNRRDVEVEMAIQQRLFKYPVPQSVWEEYVLDQEINDRGIRLDMPFVENAVQIDALTKEKLTGRLKALTGLENPNSVLQMKAWLKEQGVAAESLDKKSVMALLTTVQSPISDVLMLRQQLAKSSVKKYQAMQNTVCSDGRARGMFQFYGANRTGRWCLTGDHEVLTKEGWIRLDKWNGSHIAVWNANNEMVSFQSAKALCFEYSGKMYTYRDTRIDQCSTPDHKMRVQRRYGSAWEDMTVEEMSKCRPAIPFYGYRYHRGCANPTWLRVLIMTQADGFYTSDGSVRFNFKKERKIARCKMLLRRAEIMFAVHTYKDVTNITIPARNVPLWLRQFRTKTFGFWLLDENPDIFFDELPHWDGHCPAPNSIQYSTCNKQNADIVQALAHMSGRAAVIKLKHRNLEKHPNWNQAYVVDIWLTPKNCHEIRIKPEVSDFSGSVYCAETPTGYFLVRRNGKVWITGNSGRHIQLQNLPQNHLADLECARDLVRQGNYEALEMLYGSVPDVLSQLIRTAFIPKAGRKFIVADFAAIEARVLSWLAKERWRMDVFEGDGDIYCATAGRMFHCNVVKHGENGHLRQKGKQAELACIAEGQLVLTNEGLVPIECVRMEHLLWDGESWVSHDGVIFKGEREVITYEGLTATPDHLVWVEGKAQPIQFGDAASCGAHLVQTGTAIRLGENHQRTARLYDIRNAGKHHRFTVSGKLVHNCGYGGSVGALKAFGALESGMKEEELKPLVDAWRATNPNIVDFWWAVDRAAKDCIKERSTKVTHGIRFIYQGSMMFIELPSGRRLAYVKPRIGENQFGGESITYMGLDLSKKWTRIESYGPKLVENITQAISRDILCYAMQTLRSMDIVAHVHDELIIECDERVDLSAVCMQMARTPPWADGLLLCADGFACKFYQKD